MTQVIQQHTGMNLAGPTSSEFDGITQEIDMRGFRNTAVPGLRSVLLLDASCVSAVG